MILSRKQTLLCNSRFSALNQPRKQNITCHIKFTAEVVCSVTTPRPPSIASMIQLIILVQQHKLCRHAQVDLSHGRCMTCLSGIMIDDG